MTRILVFVHVVSALWSGAAALPAQVPKPDPRKIAAAEAKLAAAEAALSKQRNSLRARYRELEEGLQAGIEPRVLARLEGDLARVVAPVLAPLRSAKDDRSPAALRRIREQLDAPLEQAVEHVEQPVLRPLRSVLVERLRAVVAEADSPADVLALTDMELSRRAIDPLVDGSRPFFLRWNEHIYAHLPEARSYAKAHAAHGDAKDELSFAKDPLKVWTKGAPEGYARVPFGAYDILSTSGFTGSRRPSRRVNLDRDVYIALREVTNGEYFEWIQGLDKAGRERHTPKDRAGKSLWKFDETVGMEVPDKERRDHPVAGVDLGSALAYAAFRGARLPTEAEWCAMAGGPQSLKYPWGGEFKSEYCNGFAHGKKDTLPVGSFPDGRGPFGHYDVAGNVAEWTMSYEDGTQLDPANLSRALTVVVRGGSFLEHPEDVSNGWVWLRQAHHDRDVNTGIRLAISSQTR